MEAWNSIHELLLEHLTCLMALFDAIAVVQIQFLRPDPSIAQYIL